MELGATLCTPREPRCLLCPVASLCPTAQRGLQASIPAPKKKKQYEEVTEAALVLRRADGRVLVRRCQPGERWAGLWDFPRCAVDDERAEAMLLDHVQTTTGLRIPRCQVLGRWKHGVTRFRITLLAFAADLLGNARGRAGEDLQWVDAATLRELPLSTTGRRISERLTV
jgi:A/G-specific adenine glycosylase